MFQHSGEQVMAELRHQISINASAEKIYAAITTSAGLAGWWTADSKADDRIGGKAEFGFEKRRMVFRMTIETLEREKRVVWRCHGDHPEWEGTTLTWSIARENDATVLRFTHGGWKSMSDYCVMCNSTWGELMYRLKNYVESGRPDPHWRG
jgi:uncharacterized protein YndB with AHSA1/START domain